jgi:hypothetical protein
VEPVSGGDRRIDRVLDPEFVAGLEDIELGDLRGRRDLAEAEEADASYLRRLLQGRMDIIRAELERRAEEGDRDTSHLIDRLPRILAGAPAQGGAAGLGSQSFGAVPRVLVPSRADQHRRRVERLVSDDTLARLDELGPEELGTAVDALAAEERKVSVVRRDVQDVLDALRTELTRRYRSGAADVSELLESEAGRREH